MRPALEPHLYALVDQLRVSDLERLSHIDARRILFVAGPARLESRASIRPLTYGGSPPAYASGAYVKPRITIAGVPMLYEICLRPRFFLAATPHERLSIIAHEVWHIARSFDGTLDASRRHVQTSLDAIELEVASIVRLCGPSKAREMLAFEGEIEMKAWLSRPPSRMSAASAFLRAYDERDLYTAIIEQRV